MGNKYWMYGLRWKIFIAFLLVSLLPLTFFAQITNQSLETYFLSNRDREIKGKATVIADSIAKRNYLFEENNEDLLRSTMRDRSESESFRILVLDNRGIVVNDTNFVEEGASMLTSEVLEAFQQKRNVSGIQPGGATMYTAAPILDDNSDVIGMLLIVASISDIVVLIDTMKSSLGVITIVTSVVIFIAAFFLSQIIIGPLKKILRVVTLMSEGHLNQRIAIKGRDEFSQLAEAFNNMNDKLEQVEKTREEFVSNVSHELKTPLSSVKVLSESILFQENVPIEMYKEFLQDINSEIDRMTFIVNDLLTLVKLDQRSVGLNIGQADINKMVEDILKMLYPLAEQKGIELLYEDVRKVEIDADAMKLSLAVSNLVENGIKYTPNGGTVKVIVDADHQNAFITVQDTGIGIAEEEQGKVFTRFYRVDKTRDRGTGGTGLGLSITHSTVLLHNGSIRLTSKEGEGTTFVVRLPIHHNAEE